MASAIPSTPHSGSGAAAAAAAGSGAGSGTAAVTASPAEAATALQVVADYMRLSRSETLQQVYPLLAPDATYTSQALNTTCAGLPAIRTMMDGFFAKFPDVAWETTAMAVVAPSEPRPQAVRVAVEFIRRWTAEDGQAQVRSGREWIHVDPGSSRIVHVHVAPLDP
ncbi:hypothetical protein HYH02_014853 [Chlamydomonas schloesseri]|uniref:SnoaL-like domain-containing protein n=1 Tax=Chlamydomonas schloesseri TaxID=2026947 RepID=A0A835SMD7_9CHLO|nr:hypothetical protein HYH02_014853 [Chlamydomonas schloesseri]|eukprot:KAG2426138.1 hypothetical protein HYH02_014853 [Chlamydomonas schloesseri]